MTQSKPASASFGDLFSSCFGPSNMGLARPRPSGKKRQRKKNLKRANTQAWQAIGEIRVYKSTDEFMKNGVFDL